MIVKFQIIHNLTLTNLGKILEDAVTNMTNKIIKEHKPYSENEDSPISFKIEYHQENFSACLTGISLDYNNYSENYYEDYESTIRMGFEWGAGAPIDEFNDYLNEFISFLENNNGIINIIKYEDSNQQYAYWLLTPEIYELEMRLREIINFVLFSESNTKETYKRLNKSLKLRHTIDYQTLSDNLENEIFVLDFTHYQKIIELYPKIFTNSLIEDIGQIRIFRNSIMHNKGFTKISPIEFWQAKDRVYSFINEFWQFYETNNLI